ncbi:MAG: DUF615 domain-containing protein [Gammaproteobacteria bacterium]|nr:DUF615 domain-containing protein [Gammaproteobacteria bacterium]MBQ0839692.1 DUF615 domain-containing protein [Gammaproteobacteria bacterium]
MSKKYSKKTMPSDTEIADSESDEPEVISKSSRKREMTALQKTGEALLTLPAKQFAKVPITAELREALELAATLKNREGKRRQMQLVGKLMRSEDHQKIAEVLASFDENSRTFRLQFQRLEKLRDDLIDGDNDALTHILEQHPQLERQHLRQLIRQASKEREQNKGPAASRKLFKYLRLAILEQ